MIINSWSQLSNGDLHSLAIKSDSTLWAWGNNSVGQLGDITVANKSSPVQVPGSWINISARASHSVAIKSDNTLYAWGLNSSGQLGLSDTLNRSSPVQVDSSSWAKVSAGSSFTAAIKSDGTLWAWGINSGYHLGVGDTFNRSSPVQVGGTSSYSQVSAGVSHTLAVSTDNKLFAWGTSTSGQGANVARSSWTQIGFNSFAIRSDGKLYSWGPEAEGRLGLGTSVSRSSPVQVGTGTTWASASIGPSHMMMTKTDGSLWSTGSNIRGQLGVSDTITRSSPVQVDTGNSYSVVSAGYLTSAATRNDSTLWIWGDGSANFPALGVYGVTSSRSAPIQVTSSISWKMVRTSFDNAHSLGITTDGALYSWGRNDQGQLGLGDTVNRSTPQLVGSSHWTFIAAGNSVSMAVDAAGRLFTWGDNTNGVLGNATYGTNRSSPIQVGSSPWQRGVITRSFAAAITADGKLFTWGQNGVGPGVLGDGTNTGSRNSPVQVGTSSWSQVAAGFNFMMGITTGSTLFGWGYNNLGQLGINTNTARSAPTQVGALATWKNVSCGGTSGGGSGFTVGANGSGLFAWGDGEYGQLGVPSLGAVINTTFRSSPVQIATGTSWSFTVAGGSGNAFAATLVGGSWVVYGWGRNDVGQLGVGDTLNRSSPVQLSTANGTTNVTVIERGTITWDAPIAAGLMIQSTGVLAAWGDNTYGQLGTNNTTSTSIPTSVGSDKVVSYASFSQISLGGSHASAITTNGLLWTWGSNVNGQLGKGDAGAGSTASSPVQVGYIGQSFTSVSSGALHTVAIATDGSLWAWGSNSVGQLGLTDTISRSLPVQIGASSWIAISAGGQNSSHTVAIRSDGTLWTWGLNTVFGILGLNDILNRSSPTQVGADDTWTKIAAGGGQIGTGGGGVFALKSDNSLWAWGENASGSAYLGLSTNLANRSSPVQIGTFNDIINISPTQIGTNNWSSISAGYTHSTAIRSDGSLWTWGQNTSGELGSLSNYSFTAIDASQSLSTVIRSDGTLWGWGLNTSAQLGLVADVVNRSSPVQVVSAGVPGSGDVTYSQWKKIKAGPSSLVAIDSNNKLFTWGINTNNQLGDGTTVPKSVPFMIGTSSWTQVAMSLLGTSTYAIRSDGLLFAWGLNSSGQLGTGDQFNRSSPTQIGNSSWSVISSGSATMYGIDVAGKLYGWGLAGTGQIGYDNNILTQGNSWYQISEGDDHTLAIRSDRRLFAWGAAAAGQLGDNTVTAKSSPLIIGGTSSFSIVSAGSSTSAAIDINGRLFMWGINTTGQLGQNDVVARSNPTQVLGSFNQIAVAKSGAGVIHVLAMKNDNTLWSWGSNAAGQLGILTTVVSRSSPVQIGTETYTSLPVTLDSSTAYAIRSNGGLYAWGAGTNGGLGLGDTFNRSSPVQVGTNTTWTKVSAGTFFVLGISSNNLYSWGLNSVGQLGLSDTINRSSPVQIGASTYSSIASGNSYSIALDSNNRLFAWGLNSNAQLGLNSDILNRSSPVQIGTSTWSSVAAGQIQAMAIRSDNTLYAWGNNASGQLGVNDLVVRSSPTQIAALNPIVTEPIVMTTLGSFSQVSAGSSYVIALDVNNKLYAWGLNGSGQLGLNDTINRSSPTQISTSSFSQVYSGYTHAVALKSADGTVWGWGLNTSGQLGQNDAISRSSPVQVGASSYSLIAAGGEFTLAVSSGTLYGWGLNTTGQLGDGTAATKSSPVLVNSINIAAMSSPMQVGTSSWSAVSAGNAFTTGITNNNILYGWGSNGTNQLGIADTLNRSSPTQVSTSSFGLVSAGGTHTTFVLNSSPRKLFGAGLNSSGQVGDATTSNRNSLTQININVVESKSSPVQVSATSGVYTSYYVSTPTQLGSASWSKLSLGQDHTVALNASNLLYAWGRNDYGQLGDSSTINRSSPVQITSSSYTAVSSGYSHTMLLKPDSTLLGTGDQTFGQIGDLG